MQTINQRVYQPLPVMDRQPSVGRRYQSPHNATFSGQLQPGLQKTQDGGKGDKDIKIRDLIMQNNPCSLCYKINKLQCSHIIPSFVVNWVKGSSLTGHFRGTDKPNLRQTDGYKKPMLCSRCEGLLNSYETKFANKVFYPFAKAGHDIKCEDWLLKFAVSISWRSLIYLYSSEKIKRDTVCTEAEETWRQFLLGKITDIGMFEQHLITFKNSNKVSPVDEDEEYLEYILERTMELKDVYNTEGDFFICTKTAFFLIIGVIKNKHPELFVNTKIETNNNIKYTLQDIPPSIVGYLNNHFLEVSRANKEISPRQQDKIIKAFSKK